MPSKPPENNKTPGDPFYQDEFATFRQAVKQAREYDHLGWENTRKLVGQNRLYTTRSELADRIIQVSPPETIREALLQALGISESGQHSSIQADSLKQLTGLPLSKGIRALCLYFQIGQDLPKTGNEPTPQEIATFLAINPNPYDLLLEIPNPALLDLGAGDLSFEEELVTHYVPRLRTNNRSLVVHAIDRLQPGSQFGGVYHANQDRLRKFSAFPADALRFRFWANTDMAETLTLRGLLPTYTIVTCHAPATPTFAYEPKRVSPDIITAHLAQTKGTFRTICVQGEEALEVHHRGKALTFPPWKFVIQGTLTLLDLMARRGRLCVLSAVDEEVFWEILCQLIEDPQVRPPNVIFSKESLPEIFGPIYQSLSTLGIGDRLQLENITSLRSGFPYHVPPKPRGSSGYRFSSVVIRRGAPFQGIPASFTARQFSHMREESPPWCLVLLPQPIPKL